MNIISLAELFSTVLNHQVFAINFPEYREGTFTKIEITSGVQEAGGVYDFNVEFMTKGQHPSDSERVALNIIDKIDMLTNRDFCENRFQLILSKATSPQPHYVGETESGEYIFSVDFRLLVSKL